MSFSSASRSKESAALAPFLPDEPRTAGTLTDRRTFSTNVPSRCRLVSATVRLWRPPKAAMTAESCQTHIRNRASSPTSYGLTGPVCSSLRVVRKMDQINAPASRPTTWFKAGLRNRTTRLNTCVIHETTEQPDERTADHSDDRTASHDQNAWQITHAGSRVVAYRRLAP